MKIFNLFIVLFCFLLPGYGASQTIKIGVLALQGVEDTKQKWQAHTTYLNQSLSPITFKLVPLTFDDIPAIVSNHQVDYVIVNPAIYVQLSELYQVKRLLTLQRAIADKQVSLFGSVLITHSRHQQKSIRDFKNHHVAAVHSTSLGGWLIGLNVLNEQGIETGDLASVTFMGTHDKVIESVIAERIDLGVIRTGVLEAYLKRDPQLLQKIHVVNEIEATFALKHSSRLYPEWPLAELPHVSSSLSKQIAMALMKLSAEDPAAQQAQISGWRTPERYLSTSQLLKKLKLPPFEQQPPILLVDLIDQYRYWIFSVASIMLTLLLGLLFYRMRYLEIAEQRVLHTKQVALFEGVFNQSANGMIILNGEGEIVASNIEMAVMLGMSNAQLRQRNLNEMIDSEDLSKCIEAFEQLKSNRAPSLQIDVKLLIHHQAARHLWASVTLSTIEFNDQSDREYLVVVHDIDHLKKMEHKLEHEKRTNNLILNVAGDGILGIDKDGTHTFVNPKASEILGYNVDEMIGVNSHEQWHHHYPDGRVFPNAECPISSVLEEGITHRGKKETIWHKDGHAIEVDFVSTPVIENHQVTGAVIIFRES